MRYLSLVIKLAVFLLLLSFAVKNSEPVTVRYLLDWSWEVPLSLLLLITFALGLLLGLVAGSLRLFRQRRGASFLRKSPKAAARGPLG